MRYTPVNKDPDVLLKELGFTPSKSKGYILKRNVDTQFHAIVELDGCINVHIDYQEEKRVHKSSRFSQTIKPIMKKIKNKDKDVIAGKIVIFKNH